MVESVFLCAGLGQRLHPYTLERPKCMLSFLGHPLIDYQLHLHRKIGAGLTLITGAMAEKVSPEAGDITCVNNPDYESTNMVYSLACAADSLLAKQQGVIVSYGDIIYEERVLQTLLKGRCEDAIGVIIDRNWKKYWHLRSPDPLSDLETLKLRADGSIAEIGLPASQFADIGGQYIGLFYLPPRLLADFFTVYRQLCDEDRSYQRLSMTAYFQLLIQRGWRFQALPIDGGWLEFDSVTDYQLYLELQGKGSLKPFFNHSDFADL